MIGSHNGLKLLVGACFLQRSDDHAALIGRVLAMNLDKKVNDTLKVSGESFQVIGIFESDSLFENGALVVPLTTLQKMMGREGQATGLVIAAKSSTVYSVPRTSRMNGMTSTTGSARVYGRRSSTRLPIKARLVSHGTIA